MADLSKLLDALKQLPKDKFMTGPHWKVCHDLCAANEDNPAHDWVHALIHRIEGDDFNARYWYRKAGKDLPSSQSLEEEWQEISNALEKDA